VQNDPRNQPFGDRATAPKGEQYPTCATAGPQAPHQATNHGDFPIHFYRVEFKRIDGDGIAQHWKQWYPWMLDPLKPVNEIKPASNLGPPFSKLFPYSIAYDSPKAAPNNHYIRYADNHVRFIEVVFRPGETEALHGHPYPSVFATNSASGMGDDGIPGEKPQNQDHSLDAQDPHNWPIGGIAKGPAGQAFPVCVTMDPQAPHHVTDNGTYPTHFYRMEFLRIDGDGIKTHWKEGHYDVVPSGPPTKTLGQ